MKDLTKKRSKAVLIDQLVYNTAIMGAEMVYRQKRQVKSEMLASFLLPTLATWALEYVQLRKTGQTIGYKQMGLVLESENGAPLSSNQIVKRILYRDAISTFDYLKNRDAFESREGAQLPHDTYAGTIVKEAANR